MKSWSRALAALTFALSLLSFLWPGGAGDNRPLTQGSSFSGSSSQALKDLQGDRKNPYKQVDSCFRKIPPSTSNPIQNKSNPPSTG
ncbi:hypothetical protein I3843_01G203500 [Carya illinoinensis]|uniref:Uncharacterized protein n=2 Tax=Carya illinoinensis TaxID=32201 RepID=A0A8T1RPA3_CARIL|nr:uncharacterized protein LOC122303200 [Carya illinoinensis]KAG6668987.1 hypothetical protein CIPAW_01G211300 [Carya illinoinensis]KAG7997274.1 hypothetical protein I3843_01G203500 [Carya illinoinensis]